MITRSVSQSGKPPREFKLNTRIRSVVICRRALICLCVSVFAFHAFPVRAQEGKVVGHVLDLEGQWYLDGRPGQALARGGELPPGGVIRIPSPSQFAFIVVRYSDNQIITKRCRNSGECAQPILLPRAVAHDASYFEIFTEKFMKVFRSNPVSPSVNAGRSPDGVLREAVVQIKDGQVDLAPVFTEMKGGTYYVRLEKKAGDDQTPSSATIKPIEVTWSPAKSSTLVLPLQPGLYEMVLMEKRGAGFRPTLASAWFLAGDVEQYANAVGQFCEATRLTTTWQGKVNEGTVRDYLRSFLMQLNAQSTNATK
jgi:hypothetical protein